jgi:FAD/FMN-containing dehydrogenase
MTDLDIARKDGGKRTISKATFDDLASKVKGDLLRPGDDGYERRRRVWNGLVDRRPALIVGCTSTDDVVAAVKFAKSNDLLVSVRSGGHNIFGTAICEGGVVLDLSRMSSVRVDPGARTVVVGPGARWKEVDAATQLHGLAAPGGQHSEVGVGGFTLGGGLGWLVCKHGLAADNLRRAEIVTADGDVLNVSATENEDLFWAIRGGGGNFGVVTSLELQLHKVGPTVVAGMLLHPLERAGEVLRFFRDFVKTSPDDVHTIAVLMTAPTGQKAVALALCHEGETKEGAEAVRALRAFGPPVMDQVQPMPYVALQSMMDALAPAGLSYFNRSRFTKGLDDATLDRIVEAFGRAPSPFCTLFLHRLGGALNTVAPHATAFPHRTSEFCFVAEARWGEAAHGEAHKQWVLAAIDTVAGLATGAYLNDLGREIDEGEAGLRAAFGSNYERLALIKAKYDPDNFFRHNQNIKPAGTMAST